MVSASISTTETVTVFSNKEKQNMKLDEKRKHLHAGLCPECRVPLLHESGCLRCPCCGFFVC